MLRYINIGVSKGGCIICFPFGLAPCTSFAEIEYPTCTLDKIYEEQIPRWPNQLASLLKKPESRYDRTRPGGDGRESLSKPWPSQHSAGQWSFWVRRAETGIHNSTSSTEYSTTPLIVLETAMIDSPSLRADRKHDTIKNVERWRRCPSLPVQIYELTSWTPWYYWIIKAGIEMLPLLLQLKI